MTNSRPLASVGNLVESVAFIGFGEVAEVFTEVLESNSWPGRLAVSLASRTPSEATTQRLRVANLGAVALEEAVLGADLVVSLVPPAAAVAAAIEVLDHLPRGSLFIDLTSTGPEATEVIAAAAIERGARFVKGSLLGPVPVLREALPIAVAGPFAVQAGAWFRAAGFTEVLVLEDQADAAALKMVWSVVSKGLIALYAECLTAAHRLEVLDHTRSLIRSQLGFYGSDEMVARLLGSNTAAGSRRVDEMNDVAGTLRALDVPPFTIPSTIAWLRWLATLPATIDAGHGDHVSRLIHAISQVLHVTADDSRPREA